MATLRVTHPRTQHRSHPPGFGLDPSGSLRAGQPVTASWSGAVQELIPGEAHSESHSACHAALGRLSSAPPELDEEQRFEATPKDEPAWIAVVLEMPTQLRDGA
jgi:hypothetical protein